MQTLLQDLRYGARMLMKQPGFTLIAVLTLALGIGANTAIFSVVNTVLLRPLPYESPEQLVQLWETVPARGLAQTGFSYTKFTQIAEQNQHFEQVGAYTQDSFNLGGTAEPLELNGIRVTAGLLDVLKVKPALGRTILAAEDRAGGPAVAILSYGLWQRSFGANPGVVGQTITLDNTPTTVIGVMPDGFSFPTRQTDIWVPRVFEFSVLSPVAVQAGAGFLNVIARLKAGPTRHTAQAAQAAQADLVAIGQRYKQQSPGRLDVEFIPQVISLPEQLTRDIRPMLLLLFGAVGFVLLIACANVANLLLAKTVGRGREIVIRAALGATRGRIVRQFLTESLLLSWLAGSLGALLAIWGKDLLVSFAPDSIPRAAEITIDYTVLGFTAALAVLTGALFGLAPALHASKPELSETLKDASRGSTGGWRRNRLRNAVVVAEVGLSLILLVGAGLLIRSFLSLQRVNPGFDPGNLLVASVNLPPTKYVQPEQRESFYRQLLQDLSTAPGVASAGAVQYLPLGGADTRTPVAIEGQSLPLLTERPLVSFNVCTPGYFRLMGTPLLQGRYFSEQDHQAAPTVVLINESFARRFFPAGNPIGKRLITGGGTQPPREVIGVVGDVHHTGLTTASAEAF
ncbi:MAG: ABC transporter permease [Blastocatellia bacterium]